MLEPENLNVLSADKPLVAPEDDRLGYAPLARHLSDSICKMAPTEGLVLAIYGPWGSGKTTLLNFIAHYLQQMPESDQPIIVRFNPWWFSGHEDLTRRFFDQLQAVLSKWKSVAKDLKKHIGDFAELVSEAPIPYASSIKPLSQFLKQKQDVPELKLKVVNALKRQKRRILVIIDDIDRLTADEIRHLFCLIKAVADFPNVVYLLAFDKEVAIRALAETQGIPGEAYLEKIVQVPFELPLPDRISLRRLLFEKLAAILDNTPSELFDPTYWSNVYFQGIDHFIATPRDIARLINTLSVTYAAVEGEVNPVDFIAVNVLQVFCPLAYDMVQKNGEMFVGASDMRSLASARVRLDEGKRFHDSWLEQVAEEDRESVRQLLLRLFPKLEAIWDNVHYPADYLSLWRKQRRVCSPDVFPTYFRLAVPEGSISNAEMKAILSLADNTEAFGAKLVELASQKRPDGTSRVRTFLEQLEDYTAEEISLHSIPSIVQTLFNIGDELLLQDDRQGVFDFGNDIRIGRIIWQLLPRLDESVRFVVLKDAMSEGQAISIIVHTLVALGQQHGKYGDDRASPDEDRLVDSEHLAELEQIALEGVRNFAERNLLLQSKQLPSILYRWQDWGEEGEAKQWVEQVVVDNSGLLTLLERFLQRTFSQSIADVVARTHYRLDPKWLEPFLEPSQIIDRVRRLAENTELAETQRIAVNQFIREYETRQQGKDPDAPWMLEGE